MKSVGLQNTSLETARLERHLASLDSKVDRLMELMATSPATKGDESLTTEQAATFLRVHKQTLLRFTKAGLPHYSNMTKGFRFLKSDLIGFRRNFLNTLK